LAQDRRKTAAGQVYEMNCADSRRGLAGEQARGHIERIGNDREKPNAAAARLSRR
jgi:hypothetical protein